MIKNRLTIERNGYAKGGWYVTVDSAVKYCETLPEATEIVARELEMFDALRSINDDYQNDVARLNKKLGEVKKALDESCEQYEKMTAERDREKAEKNKWVLEAYTLKETIVGMAKKLSRC